MLLCAPIYTPNGSKNALKRKKRPHILQLSKQKPQYMGSMELLVGLEPTTY